jgi:hypothetical protein
MTTRRRTFAAGCFALTVALILAGCTGGSHRATRVTLVPAGSLRMVAFDNCVDALAGLRTAAKASVGPYGLPGIGAAYAVGVDAAGGPVPPAAAGGALRAAAPATPAYSGTNTHEIGVDEPDLVKTDGHRIVTVSGGVLRVIDAATRTITGRLDLSPNSAQYPYAPINLLLDGDHALLLLDGYPIVYSAGPATGPAAGPATGPVASSGRSDPSGPAPISGPRLLLVDLAGQPRILATYTIDGGLVDARQIGDIVRVVIRSAPRISFPALAGTPTDAQRTIANRAVIAGTDASAWLPRYEVTQEGTTSRGHIACDALQRPASYTGANLLTVLTFDLAAGSFGDGDGISIAADGDTVYGTDTSLYVASDQRSLLTPMMAGGPAPAGGVAVAPSVPAARTGTEIYRFDISQPGRPRFVAGGHVPGYLVDQYALSEWNGLLRIATTTGTSWAAADGRPTGAQPSASAVYVLTPSGPVMRQVGVVDGLGKGERIYSVRFIGAVGYVVTFRQTDPLYTVDLSDPAHPRIRGAVQLTGYSAYLHPASDSRLIGIGQQADAQGHIGGTQVSLFDVADLTAPKRMSTFAIAGGQSAAEFDPHAFLYWPAANLVVVPLQTDAIGGAPPIGTGLTPTTPRTGALLLRMADTSITETGFISQPAEATKQIYSSNILRSLVIGSMLWTVSDTGAMATDITSLGRVAWIPFG